CKLAAKHEPTEKHFNDVVNLYQTLSGNSISIDQLHSTLGRIIGRSVRCCVLNETLSIQWQALVDNIGK
ncbi:nickel-dependent hydrogenase large subunit, partial [Vibrio parahaemolyticus]